MTLPVTVAFHDDEAALDLPSRLAHANGYSSVRRFVSAAGIKTTDVARGEHVALSRLSKWSGVELARLAAFAITRHQSTRWTIGHAAFDKEARLGNRYRFCPCCIAEDLAHGGGRPGARAYTRASWMTRAVATCIVHRRPILEVPYTTDEGRDFSRYVADNAESISRIATASGWSSPSPLDAYLHDRILGVMREPFLDMFEAYVVAGLCTHLGRFLKRHRTALGSVPAYLWDASDGDLGLHVARQGEANIREIVAAALQSAWIGGASKMSYRSLAVWLRGNSNDENLFRVFELFQDIAERSLPFEPGELALTRVRCRHLHTVRSAALEFSMSETRVLQLIRSSGLAPDPAIPPRKILMGAQKAQELLAAATATLTSKQARELLDVSELVMSQILKAKLIQVVEQKESGRDFARIRREDLVRFQEDVFSQARRVENDVGFLKSIQEGCRRCGCSYDEILRLIRDRTIEKVYASDNHNFRLSYLLVDWREVVANVVDGRKSVPDTPDGLLNCRDAERSLRVASATVRYLIDNSHLLTQRVRNVRTNRNQSFITLASVEKFKTEHISIADLAVQLETHPIAVERMLSKNGVQPIYEREGRVARFYKRSELASLHRFSL